ncbi:MAG: asparagine synthase (glutamine-hydrolyzing) [Chitinophagales bacterium]|nr:asparagine synthase (glutamine-hydrolyzing) [Chitinophagales bacterium]
MCGIAGIISFREKVDEQGLVAMRDRIKHRGPDGDGIYLSENGHTGLAHRRLSFLDLSDNGRQPMSNETGDVWLVFNGEIYNYPTIKNELIAKGHVFSSTCDAEVIVHGYEEWGTHVVKRLKGMFALAIWDARKHELFLARDRFGIKPLYYYHTEEHLIFASEIKAIHAYPGVKLEINERSISEFLTYRYVPPPNTIYRKVKKLPPATFLTIKENGAWADERYWNLESANLLKDEREVVHEVDRLLLRSVEGHLLSDVPVGSFLSGGYDSSAMVYYANRLQYPLQTFSIGFDNWDDSEHRYARIVADLFHTQHKETVLPDTSIFMAEDLGWVYDEPLADISIIPTYAVSQLAAKNVKAVLSGEGADELFGGYWWQKKFFNDYGKRRLLLDMNNIFRPNHPIQLKDYAEAMSMGYFGSAELEDILSPRLQKYIPEDTLWFYRRHLDTGLSPLKSIQYMDINCFMAELVLQKIDRASMANSLEVRVPFMDHELFELVFSLDEKVYFKPEATKFLLFENLKGHLPEVILNRPKQGFVGPDQYFMNIDHYRKVLVNGHLLMHDIITDKGLNKLLAAKDHWRLWKLLVLEYWVRKWLSN